ncbi:guanine nucleotide-binding protein G(s) subunit alpha-like [Oppia nitens]|uniref:guanine nucleotide-binding protein G(s) subunit alpha-like n=1 Tax=Oppia nitens TaxID=1686743 RepID=UPI0023DA023F|nr:guanine nucleotide-binding protein G(s) subunit alpha-like [Oppia nitens]
MPVPLCMTWCHNNDPNRRASKELDKKINIWMKKYKKSIKLLLLGAGESGKTTIIKQMKILHISGFSDTERMEKVIEIKSNILEAIKELTANMSYLKPPIVLHNKDYENSLQFIHNLDMTTTDSYQYPDEFFRHVKLLWSDPGIQECYRRSNEYTLIDCAKYFLDKIDIIKAENYVPSDQDILNCRKRTSEIQRIEFEMKVPLQFGGGTQMFWMFDVGGQRGERRKWIQVFDGITAILFMVACSDFDMQLREDNQTNRLRESLDLFDDVWNSKFLIDAGFILFLNKQDILKEKIERGSKIENYFPEYNNFIMSSKDGDPNDRYLKTRSFIRELFLEITRKPPDHRKFSTSDYVNDSSNAKKRGCFCHFTTATDTNNIRRVFEDVHTMIIIDSLTKIGLT